MIAVFSMKSYDQVSGDCRKMSSLLTFNQRAAGSIPARVNLPQLELASDVLAFWAGTEPVMFTTVVRRFCAVCLCTAACGGTGIEPSEITASARLVSVDPAVGTTLASGSPFKVTFSVQWAQSDTSYMVAAVALVRDDGQYSPPLACHKIGAPRYSSQTMEAVATGIVGKDRGGNILYEFSKGHRVNALLLVKATPEREGCAPISTLPPGLSNPTEGTVFPENADQRVDATLNWFIQP
jgi:hypothetical protein